MYVWAVKSVFWSEWCFLFLQTISMVAFNVGWNSRISLAILTLSASAAATVYLVIKRTKRSWQSRIRELEASLSSAIDKCSAERQGRIRAQQELRKAIIAQPPPSHDKLQVLSYPMTPIGVVRSCFSTRNGTPRQPLLVPLARACLMFDSSRVPPASLEGLEEYSHCWIVYVFHLNTDLEKLWKHPSRSKFKAKVRVPRLKGERVGVFATRSPHRPCPIGLTVAKVEAVKGHMVVLSGVDLVDGTPVLDIKPYLPYCDSVHEATVPNWVKGDNLLAVATVKFSKDFASKLAECWAIKGNKSLYTSADEFQELIREVLSWDIRSVSQRQKQHPHVVEQKSNSEPLLLIEEEAAVMEDNEEEEDDDGYSGKDAVIYHLVLEELDVSYKIDKGHVFVDGIMPYQPSTGAAQ